MKIIVSIPVIRPLPFQTVNSITSLALLMRQIDPQILLEVHWISQCSFIEKARNMMISEFLKTDGDVMVMVDQDIAFVPQDLLRLVKLVRTKKIVGAPYPFKNYPIQYMVQFHPPGDERGQSVKFEEFDEDGCHTIYSMGMGFVAIAREVLEKMSENSIKVMYDKDVWLPQVTKTGPDEKREFHGEDWWFYHRARTEFGYTPYMDGMITIGHIGDHMYYQQVTKQEPTNAVEIQKG